MPGDEVVGASFQPFLLEVWHWLPHMPRRCEDTLRGIVKCRARSRTAALIAVRERRVTCDPVVRTGFIQLKSVRLVITDIKTYRLEEGQITVAHHDKAQVPPDAKWHAKYRNLVQNSKLISLISSRVTSSSDGKCAEGDSYSQVPKQCSDADMEDETFITEHPPPVFVSEDMSRNGRGLWTKLLSSYYRSQGNRPDVLGTPDPELVNQGHDMSKQSRARSHHSLLISDPHWATPTHDPTGPSKTNPSGLPKTSHTDPAGPNIKTTTQRVVPSTDPSGPTETSTRTSCQYGLPNMLNRHHLYTTVSLRVHRPNTWSPNITKDEISNHTKATEIDTPRKSPTPKDNQITAND
ncbi:hypothetical protein AVEN_270367-1 [Araneus ventricosus]|uniref:Uncharacterized protein n=1 Tax=Araneus ventricosus TaxID=182803 RepID=A0A4Y2MIC3_ARAVE|nr:hypothetical protein AVEN_270367-1 [Araneus ventricosus]